MLNSQIIAFKLAKHMVEANLQDVITG